MSPRDDMPSHAPHRPPPDAPASRMHMRPAQQGDARAISELICTLSAKFIAGRCAAPVRQKLLATMSPDAIAHNLRAGYRYHVGEIDGRLVGVVGTRHYTHIQHLFVAEAEHGQGYASRLWAVAQEDARLAGAGGEFTVNASQHAHGIYRHWGFVAHGERRTIDGVIDIPLRWTASAPDEKADVFLPDLPPA